MVRQSGVMDTPVIIRHMEGHLVRTFLAMLAEPTRRPRIASGQSNGKLLARTLRAMMSA